MGGLCKYAPSLPAFGNMTAASFLRLVPHQEAPTMVCWSYSNRSALIRVPLGWRGIDNLASVVNPQQKEKFVSKNSRQTVEMRNADGSANTHLLLAGFTTAALWAFNNKKEALKYTEDCFVVGNIHDDEEVASRLIDIALSCEETADNLIRDRKLYEKEGIFPASIINRTAEVLRKEKDRGLNRRIAKMPEDEAAKIARDIMHNTFSKY
ncbi:MAG: hypothetical protein B7C24_15000 [Bacteroidetes bacterium 4572_77]|nr:MAG: hypothetical protein B7C24_15000 [Bacteroidetes bacterium 4572_77]